MSIADDREKLLERMEQGRQDILNSAKIPDLPKLTTDEIKSWKIKKNETIACLKRGVYSTNEWRFIKPVWVEFVSGEFYGRSFSIKCVNMNPNVLILYSEKCSDFELFQQKVSKILQNLRNYSVIYPCDEGGFIKTIIEEKSPSIKHRMDSEWSLDSITHAIIFCNGDDFLNEISLFKDMKLPLRVIYTHSKL